MFLYALGIIVQPPCYDTIAAAQLTLKEPFTFRSLSDCGLKRLVASAYPREPCIRSFAVRTNVFTYSLPTLSLNTSSCNVFP